MKSKSRKADLEGMKTLFFEAGIVVALSFALAAFEWPTSGDLNFTVKKQNGPEIPTEIIPITRPERIVPPPPPLPPVEIIIHENNIDLPPSDPDVFVELTQEKINELIQFLNYDEPEVDEVVPFMQIEVKPTFMGGDYNTFTEWVFRNLHYPDEAIKNGIQGRVYVEFLIDIDGMVKNVRVIKGSDKLLNEEAVRIVSSSPPWSPGFQRDKATKVLFTFPINFRLKD